MLKISIIGLGYVGLPVALSISKKFPTVGYDVNNKRIETLKKKNDYNNEFKLNDFKNKKIKFSKNSSDLKKCNFYIICVPTPINQKKNPDLSFINKSIITISKFIKKGDIIVIESTVYPGVTHNASKYLELVTKLKNNKDFFMCYSPERINPGDKEKKLKNINKIFAVETGNKDIITKIKSVYKLISKKLIFSKNIKEAETAKAIENTQRDLNIALFNEILMMSNKLNLNFNEIIRLASTKWNFLKFRPGLVGGHCLPVDPYYLAYASKQKKFRARTLLAGRLTNNSMKKFVINYIKNEFLNFRSSSKIRILIIGLSYKYGVADLRNSLNLEIYQEIKKLYSNTFFYDPFLKNSSFISKEKEFEFAIFLSYGKKYKLLYDKLKNNSKIIIIDPFRYFK